MRKFCCAYCGVELTEDAFIFQDDFLQWNYFNDNKSNRFCSRACACDALHGVYVSLCDIPLDKEEKDD